jgi:uracil-DNA glycosylase family 4
MNLQAYKAALQWYVDQDLAEALEQEPRGMRPQPLQIPAALPGSAAPIPLVASSDLKHQAVNLAASALTIEALREAIASFDGIALKSTATNLVFADGHPDAKIMLIGEAPGADEDRQGKPFAGASGQLLDRILASIGLGRFQEDTSKAVYLTNILNWRPPGNRTPSPQELELSLPFIARHIELVQPQILVICGGLAAKSLLGGGEQSISKLRGCWHLYRPLTKEVSDTGSVGIPAIVTYHPAYLLRTPAQKRAVWQDMLTLQEKREKMAVSPQ